MERITKIMMLCLLAIMVLLAVNSVLIPGASEGLKFYLLPDFGKMAEAGIGEVVFAAMGQAFFTLSIGMGGMAIFGSYIDRRQSLTGESARIIALDTFVAIMSGLIIFPACFAYGVNPGSGRVCCSSRCRPSSVRWPGAIVGRLILPLHEFRGHDHADRRIREHRQLLDRRAWMEPQAGERGQLCGDHRPVDSLYSRLQPLVELPAAGTGDRRPRSRGFRRQHHAATP